MNRKKEACRNFMRGSCQYGERCKFSHSLNTQQQQQQPFSQNQNQNQPRGKPFENKWTRTPDTTTTNNQQSQAAAAATHTCTDPEACKRIIVEDFEKERPLWKLTCYAHFKHFPCDIVGDISYEELRAIAYDEAKKGVNLASVVERERNVLNSKLVEFDKFKSSPYKINASPFPSSNNVASPAVVSSFSQLGMSVNQGSNNMFGQPTRPIPSFGQPTSQTTPPNPSFGQPTSQTTPPNPIFGQPATQTTPPNPSFGQPTTQTTPPNPIFRQPTTQTTTPNPIFGQQQTPFSFSQTNASSFPVFPSQAISNSFGQQQSPFPVFPSAQTPASQGLFGTNQKQAQQTHGNSFMTPPTLQSPSILSTLGTSTTQYNGDMTIWNKESWEPGEIPEDAPPDTVCV